jgi:hypothetical protein
LALLRADAAFAVSMRIARNGLAYLGPRQIDIHIRFLPVDQLNGPLTPGPRTAEMGMWTIRSKKREPRFADGMRPFLWP